MVELAKDALDVTLFFPSRSLLLEIEKALVQCRPLHLRRAADTRRRCVEEALDGTDIAVIDATERPAEATAVLEESVALIGPDRSTIYSQRMHPGLEVFTRSRGAQLFLGPLTTHEWTAFLAWFRGREKHIDRAPCDSPLSATWQPRSAEAWRRSPQMRPP